MAQTPFSAASSYISPANFLLCYSPSIAANMLRAGPSYPNPSYCAMTDPTNPAGAKLQFHLNIGAGEIEAACAVAQRYTPDDLGALTGVSQDILWKLNAARGMWSLAQFLKPITARMEDVPFAKESFEILQMLRDGELIFGFRETMEAGLPAVQPPNMNQLVTPNALGYVAGRLFPASTFGRQSNQGNRGGDGGGW